MEDESFQIIKKLIPKEWVIREFNRPDYGIDLVIELFDKVDEQISETLGEFIYVQVKSVKQIEIKKEKVFPVGNVAKGKWKEDKTEYSEIDVVKFVFDINSLFTIQTLGGSVSVLLFLVDIVTENVYFICINDYIDKIILPKNSKYTEQDSYTITIPTLNALNNIEISNNALKFYGKRAKLLASFSKFSYQKNELSYLLKVKDFPIFTYREELEKDKVVTNNDILEQVLFFIEQIEELDIWEHKEWQVLPLAKTEIIELKNYLQSKDVVWEIAREKIIICWHRLTNLGTMYEDLCREWFLPKMISLLTSYPTLPEIIKTENKANA
ncbi:DUF4365 domain-containing protein [Flavobacterium columnare]|nr:DUF4365 domain-containing protein [Flavobacterium columnare]